MRKVLLLSAFFLLIIQLNAQTRKHIFYTSFADNGLASDRTTTVFEDHLGFIWVGTEEGLNRMLGYYDFDTFHYSRTDSTTLSNNFISVLFEDSQQRLWVGTRNGLNLFQRATDSFVRINLPHTSEATGDIRILDMKEDENGNLWLICNNHLVKVNGESLEEEKTYSAQNASGSDLSMSVIEFFESRLRVGTSGGVYTLVDDELKKSQMAGSMPVSDMLVQGEDLWIGTVPNGVIRYNGINGSSKYYRSSEPGRELTSDHINGMCLVDNEKIWVATLDGLSIIDPVSDEVEHILYDFNDPYSIQERTIRSVFQDKNQVIWITTPNSGLSYYHKADNLFRYYGQTWENGTSKDLMDYLVVGIYTSGNEAWLGSRKGLSHFKEGRFQHFPLPDHLRESIAEVTSIARHNEGPFWLGTNHGLLQWDAQTGKYKKVLTAELPFAKINSLVFGKDEKLWIGTEDQGLKVYDTSSGTIADFSLKKGSDYDPRLNVGAVLPVEDKVMLVGTTEGLYKIENGFSEQIDLSRFMGGLSSDISINTLGRDKDGNIIIGTQQDGLLVLNSFYEPLFRAGTKEKLASKDIRGVVLDDEGKLWVTTNAGLSKVTYTQKGIDKVQNYDLQDGLQGDHFIERSAAKLLNGHLLFGGSSGLTEFHPDEIVDFVIKQNPTFTGLLIDGKEVKPQANSVSLPQDISIADRITLEPNQDKFTLDFNALDYLRPYDAEYRYQLKGYDPHWINQKQEHTATYQNLVGGRTYEFVLQSKGRFSDWSDERTLLIEVQPEYFETIWFRVVVVLAIVLLVASLFWLRVRASAKKKKELEGLVQERSAALQEEVTIRRKTEEKLKEALMEAKRASDVKSQFLANMSHEIRTPLNGILGMTELSLDTNLDQEQHDILNTIYKSASSLKSIVNDILDIAKIEAGELQILNERFCVKETLDQVMASFQLEANRKRLSLKHWVLPKVPDAVFGDAGRLRQILVNLVSNAIKFTHSGSVTVIVDAMNQRTTSLELWFTVTDTGIGIPKQQQENVFRSFIQADSGHNRVYGGTGLGLSISKELVEKMGGEIWVESEEGKGSIFSFYVRVEEYLQKGTKEESKAPLTYSGKVKGKVLLVEDTPTNQEVATRMLQKNDIEVVLATTGKEALALIEKHTFDLVLMDLQMPEIDGYETTRLIRNSDAVYNGVPIIALTAAAMDGDRERCMAAGMDGYLAKPISSRQLIEAISKFLQPETTGFSI